MAVRWIDYVEWFNKEFNDRHPELGKDLHEGQVVTYCPEHAFKLFHGDGSMIRLASFWKPKTYMVMEVGRFNARIRPFEAGKDIWVNKDLLFKTHIIMK